MTPEIDSFTSKERVGWISPATASKIALAAAALNLASMGLHAHQFVGASRVDKPAVEATSQSPAVHPRDLLKNTRVITIEGVNGEDEPVRYHDAHIRNSIRSAKSVLEGLSRDALTLPDQPVIHRIKLTPDGLYTDKNSQQSIECYSDEQLDRVQTLYLENNDLPAATSLMTVINQGESCSLLPLNGVAAVDNINGMRIGSMYVGALTDNVILHEVGHVLGLSHAATLDCDNPAARTMMENSETDIGTLVGSGCEIPKRHDGSHEADMYSDRGTVMGGIAVDVVDQYTEHFNSHETVKLAPDIARNKDVSLERATYELSTLYEELRTISFILPDEHPLRKIDAKIDKVSIGVRGEEFGDHPNATVQVIAHHEGQSYKLMNAFSYIAGYDENLGPVVVYHDETLGIKAIIHPGKNQFGVKVAVEPIE